MGLAANVSVNFEADLMIVITDSSVGILRETGLGCF